MDRALYNKMAELVVDKLEGGYFHPNMLKDGRVKDQRYASSGETMFGIDRKAGGDINTTPAGRAFWGEIDKAGAANNWHWNYMGGALQPKLRSLAADVMYPEYDKYAGQYLSPATRKIVEGDQGLLFHFIYGTWNGPGWFKKFAQDMNAQVAKGVTDTIALKKVAIDSRTKEGLKPGSPPNSLVAQGGNKIAQFFFSLPSNTLKAARENPITTAVITAALIVGIYLIIKVTKK